MFDGCRQSTETGHTSAVAFLVIAFLFSPAILVVSRSLGYASVLLAIACSVPCLGLVPLEEVPAALRACDRDALFSRHDARERPGPCPSYSGNYGLLWPVT